MNLNQLKLFYLTAKLQSVSAAADALFITQPAVTKGIRRFQDENGVRLFQKFGRELVLTEAGAALYRIAEKIFEMERIADDCIRSFQSDEDRRIEIQSSETFGVYYLPDIINSFTKANPRVIVSVNILPSAVVVENTASMKNDLGFITSPISHKVLQIQEVLKERLVIIVPPNHPFAAKDILHPRELNGQIVIMHEAGSDQRRIIDKFVREQNITISMPIALSNNEAIKRAVEDGVGIALISEKAVQKETQTGKLKMLLLSDPSVMRTFYCIHHREKYLQKSLRCLLDIVARWAAGISSLPT